MTRQIIILIIVSLQWGCTRLPETVKPVENFDLNQYIGPWYEIARMDHSFERNLIKVTANYSRRDDGGINVINRGYNVKTGEWEQAEGKAYFVGDPHVGHLKVSFFGPFYSSYVVIALDKENYRYALVGGPDFSYLWILARTPTLDSAIKQQLIQTAGRLGYETKELIMVPQE